MSFVPPAHGNVISYLPTYSACDVAAANGATNGRSGLEIRHLAGRSVDGLISLSDPIMDAGGDGGGSSGLHSNGLPSRKEDRCEALLRLHFK